MSLDDHDIGMHSGMMVQTAVGYQARVICPIDSMKWMAEDS